MTKFFCPDCKEKSLTHFLTSDLYCFNCDLKLSWCELQEFFGVDVADLYFPSSEVNWWIQSEPPLISVDELNFLDMEKHYQDLYDEYGFDVRDFPYPILA